MDIIQTFYDELVSQYDKLFQDWQATGLAALGYTVKDHLQIQLPMQTSARCRKPSLNSLIL